MSFDTLLPPVKPTALDGAVKFQVKGVDDEMAVFRVEKNRGYTVMSNHHLRGADYIIYEQPSLCRIHLHWKIQRN